MGDVTDVTVRTSSRTRASCRRVSSPSLPGGDPQGRHLSIPFPSIELDFIHRVNLWLRLRLVTSQGSPYPSRSPRAHPSGFVASVLHAASWLGSRLFIFRTRRRPHTRARAARDIPLFCL